MKSFDSPTMTLVRPYEGLFGPIGSAGDCLDFLSQHAVVWFDLSQPCRSGDVCLLRDCKNDKALLKQILFKAGKWLVLTSYSILPMGDRYEPLGPLVAIAEHIGPMNLQTETLHEPHKAEFRAFLDELERRYPKQVSRAGGLVTSLVGDGPVWKSN